MIRQLSVNDPSTTFNIDLVAEGVMSKIIDNPLFYHIRFLIPFFAREYPYSSWHLIQDRMRGSANIIRVFLSAEQQFDARARVSATDPQIRIGLALYLAFWALPSTLTLLTELFKEVRPTDAHNFRWVDMTDVCEMTLPKGILGEVDALLSAWGRSDASGGREKAVPDWIVQLLEIPATSAPPSAFPNPNIVVPALFFIIGHEFGHYYQKIVTSGDPYQQAEAMIKRYISSYERFIPDEGKAVASLLTAPVLENWKKEIAADQWAFLATSGRLDPEYNGERIPPVAMDRFSQGEEYFIARSFPRLRNPMWLYLSHEPVIDAKSEAEMYALVGAEIVFGLIQLREFYLSNIRGKQIPMDTHPPAAVRKKMFVYARAESGLISQQEVVNKYRLAFITRAMMEKILKECADRY